MTGKWHKMMYVVFNSLGLEKVTAIFNTLRPRQNGRHFTDDIFKYISLNENVWFLFKISLKFVSKGLINNIPALVQIMAWRRPGDKPLSQSIMVSSLMHICVSQPQWAKIQFLNTLLWSIVTITAKMHEYVEEPLLEIELETLLIAYMLLRPLLFEAEWHIYASVN